MSSELEPLMSLPALNPFFSRRLITLLCGFLPTFSILQFRVWSLRRADQCMEARSSFHVLDYTSPSISRMEILRIVHNVLYRVRRCTRKEGRFLLSGEKVFHGIRCNLDKRLPFWLHKTRIDAHMGDIECSAYLLLYIRILRLVPFQTRDVRHLVSVRSCKSLGSSIRRLRLSYIPNRPIFSGCR